MSSDEPTKPSTPVAPSVDGVQANRRGANPTGYRTLIPAGSPTAANAPLKPPGKSDAAKPETAKPSANPETSKDSKDENRPDPTRFGDWEVKGRCIDF